MSSLPCTELQLVGGCFCNAIKYTINIPAEESRPYMPRALALRYTSQTTADKPFRPKYPNLEIDHCGSCRRACGSVVQAWVVVPVQWVTFGVAARPEGTSSVGPLEETDQAKPYQHLDAKEMVRPSSDLIQRTYIGSYSSNGESWRTFCTRCGTGLTFFYSGTNTATDEMPVMDIAMGTLQREHLEQRWMKPQRHCHWESGIPWVKDILYNGSGPVPRHPRGMPNALIEDDQWMVG